MGVSLGRGDNWLSTTTDRLAQLYSWCRDRESVTLAADGGRFRHSASLERLQSDLSVPNPV